MADLAAPDQNAINASALSQVQSQQAPVISSLQAQQPTLEKQYSTLMDTLKGQQGIATGNTGIQTQNDFGARGIPLSSGLFNQTLGQRIQPIAQDYTNQMATATGNQTNALQQLATQIAQAQASVQDQARQLGQQNYSNAYSAYNDQQNRIAAAAIAAANRGATPNPSISGGQGGGQTGGQNPLDIVMGAVKGIGDGNTLVDDNELARIANQLTTMNGLTPNQAQVYLQQLFDSGRITHYSEPAKLGAFNPSAFSNPLKGGSQATSNSGGINLGNMGIGGSIR